MFNSCSCSANKLDADAPDELMLSKQTPSSTPYILLGDYISLLPGAELSFSYIHSKDTIVYKTFASNCTLYVLHTGSVTDDSCAAQPQRATALRLKQSFLWYGVNDFVCRSISYFNFHSQSQIPVYPVSVSSQASIL